MSWDSNSTRSNQSGTHCLVLPGSYFTSPGNEKRTVKQSARREKVFDTWEKIKRKRRKERQEEGIKCSREKEELLTAPVTFPPPASLVLPRAVPWYTDSTQHLCQHHQQQQGHPAAGHACTRSLHRGYSSRESKAMGTAVPHSVMPRTAVWTDPKQRQNVLLLLGSPQSVSPEPRHWRPRGVTHSPQATPPPPGRLELSFWGSKAS